MFHTPVKHILLCSMNPYGWERNWITHSWFQTRCAIIALTCNTTLVYKYNGYHLLWRGRDDSTLYFRHNCLWSHLVKNTTTVIGLPLIVLTYPYDWDPHFVWFPKVSHSKEEEDLFCDIVVVHFDLLGSKVHETYIDPGLRDTVHELPSLRQY